MSEELVEILKLYSTGTHEEVSSYLIGKSEDTLSGVLVNLITRYINDKNSSTVREFITVTLAGYTHKVRWFPKFGQVVKRGFCS